MRHAVTVGMGFGKKSLEDAILNANIDDVIIIEPGEYTVENGFTVQKLDIRGQGNSPKDVIIHTKFSVNNGGILKLENLTLINGNNNDNAVFVSPSGQLVSKRIIIENKSDGYPAVFLREAKGSFTACEIFHSIYGQNGVYAEQGSYVLISKCDITSIYISESRVESLSSQIQNYLSVSKNSEFTADNLYINNPLDGIFLISLIGESILKANELIFPENSSSGHVENSRFRVQKTNVDEFHEFEIQVEGNYDVDVPGAKLYQPQIATSGSQETNNDDDNESKKTSSEVANNNSDKEIIEKQHEKTIIDQSHYKPALEQLHEMIGLDKLKKQVDAFIKVTKFNKKREEQGAKTSGQSLHSLFLGNPGTGKTTVARLVAKVMYENGVMPTDKYVEVTRQDLVSEYIGKTAIKTEEVLKSALGGVLFIDEAYTLYQEGSANNWGQEAVDTILKYMEDHRNEIMIIFAGYTKEMKDFINMNPGLASRVPNVFEFEDYTPAEIAQIGIMSLHNQDYEFDEEYYKKAVMQKFKADIDNSNGRWIRNFNDKLIQSFVMSLPDDDSVDIFKIPNSIIDELTGGDQNSKDTEVNQLLNQLNSMVGLHNVKNFVNDLVEKIKIEQKLQDQLPDSEKPTYHMVFSGAPGTGKTTVARIIAKLFYNLGILPKDTVNEVSRPDLVGRYVGETEEKTSTVIRNAMGGVLFVDEAYQLTENSGNDFGKQAIETFITELENNRDKFVAIFAGYTKEMNSFLDANAGLRSRIPLTIEFEDYTPEEIAQIVLLIVTKNWTVNEDLLKTVVTNAYRQLPDSEKSNGRWARNFADKIINEHKLWLVNHLNEDIDVTHINDDLLIDSTSW